MNISNCRVSNIRCNRLVDILDILNGNKLNVMCASAQISQQCKKNVANSELEKRGNRETQYREILNY